MTRNSTRTAQLTRAFVVVVVALTVVGAVAPGMALAQSDNPPQTPHRYFGTVTDNGGSGVADEPVTVTYDGEEIASTTTNADGDYGVDVTGSGLSAGDTVTISVGDQSQDESWESGGSAQVDFQLDVGGGGGDDGGGGGGGDDGGGGGGGGGAGTGSGGGSVDVPDISDELGDDAEITEDSEGIITTGDDGTSSVTFLETSNVESITFSGEVGGTAVVRNIDGTPAATGSPPGTSVTISDITVPEDARDSPATIRKRVSNDRLSDLGVEDQELAIYRFADGGWTQLDTGVASETDSGMILEAETPGFSFFAVSTVEDAPADDGGADDADTDLDQESGGLNPTIIGLIGLVVLIAVGVGLYTRRE